jgi:sporulation protein YlmC with PRC-barrel domain
MLVSELMRSEVRSESGEKLGHVFDIRVARSPNSATDRADQQWRVTGLLVGRQAWRERFGIAHDRPAGPRHASDAIPWESVVSVDAGRIVVKGGTQPE